MTTLARVHDERHGDVAVARVEGEVDLSNVHEIGDRVRSAAGGSATALVVDLSPTTYLDSAGINLLFALGEELRQRRVRLDLVVAEGSPIARMVSLTGVPRTLPVHATLAEALDAAPSSLGP